MNDNMGNAVGLSHLFLRERVKPGDRVVDATCGNGHDTLFLAGLVEAEGAVFAFDVQEQALEKTRLLLEENKCLDRVQLFHAGHQELAAYVPDPVQAVAFNLGYLPGSDKSCITRAATTLAALEQASYLVVSGGVIVVVIYPGHDGGGEEAAAVEYWARSLPRSFSAWCSRQVNRSSAAPYVVLAAKVS
ncbi:rRNA methyltransferase, putative [Geotalea daltonii FRC-32]|uniref:rRNA methyltransferase, putative n=1 Tax=Geotalea daltonii (strain DSM 22248 / JCM 15807 / FRC-32) TaxID=316067 RepID=B9M6Y0_GEODF|nr:class I SAM-dependent methyltransferase [Geotalea daltonii]ACM22001.2 rRNA methyltransferase, putative [Geotalea daltonii FRC-32]